MLELIKLRFVFFFADLLLFGQSYSLVEHHRCWNIVLVIQDCRFVWLAGIVLLKLTEIVLVAVRPIIQLGELGKVGGNNGGGVGVSVKAILH